MINLTFELNNQPMSVIKSGTRTFAAFCGLGSFINKRSTMCLPTFGSILYIRSPIWWPTRTVARFV